MRGDSQPLIYIISFQVHFRRSCTKIATVVCFDNLDVAIFSALGERILNTQKKGTSGRVLPCSKEKKLEDLKLSDSNIAHLTIQHPETWARAKNWANWWLQENNLSKWSQKIRSHFVADKKITVHRTVEAHALWDHARDPGHEHQLR